MNKCEKPLYESVKNVVSSFRVSIVSFLIAIFRFCATLGGDGNSECRCGGLSRTATL